MNRTSRRTLFIKVPPLVVHSDHVDDGAVVTMIRLLELAWQYKYRKTASYTPDELADLLHRTRATMWRHLKTLREAGWIDSRRASGRRLIVQILLPILDDDRPAEEPGSGPMPAPSPRIGTMARMGVRPGGNGSRPPIPVGGRPLGAQPREALRQALVDLGVVGGPLRELCRMSIDPAVVKAWSLWTWHPDQEWMDNPTGFIVQRLRGGDEPPPEFIELACLTDEEVSRLRDAYYASEEYSGWPSLDGQSDLQRLAPLWAAITRSMRAQ